MKPCEMYICFSDTNKDKKADLESNAVQILTLKVLYNDQKQSPFSFWKDSFCKLRINTMEKARRNSY